MAKCRLEKLSDQVEGKFLEVEAWEKKPGVILLDAKNDLKLVMRPGMLATKYYLKIVLCI